MVDVQGWRADEIDALDDRDVRIRYYEAPRRRPTSAQRRIETADDFVCPQELQAGRNVLQAKVRKGQDINSHLSKGHASIKCLDGLLAEWGVHHFHLGTDPDPRNKNYIGRTGPLLYAVITDDSFLAINVYDHRCFNDISILESVHRNWPELVRRYRVNGVIGGEWTAADRGMLRANSANILTSVSDGTVYMPITGGVNASGMNAEALKTSDYWHIWIRELQREFETELDSFLPLLRERGYAGEIDIDAQLIFSDNGLQILFPKYGVLAVLNTVEKR